MSPRQRRKRGTQHDAKDGKDDVEQPKKRPTKPTRDAAKKVPKEEDDPPKLRKLTMKEVQDGDLG